MAVVDSEAPAWPQENENAIKSEWIAVSRIECLVKALKLEDGQLWRPCWRQVGRPVSYIAFKVVSMLVCSMAELFFIDHALLLTSIIIIGIILWTSAMANH